MQTQAAITNCNVVAYTSFALTGMTPLIVPPKSKKCIIAFISETTTRIISNANIISIVHKRTADTWNMSNRKFSKIPKLCPHLLFGNRTSIFFDTKLHMQTSLHTLSALSRNGQLTAFRHPHCPKKKCDPYVWMLREVEALSRTPRVDNKTLLHSQVKSYQTDRVNQSCKTYIEGALLIQKNAHALFERWSDEVFSGMNSDRDQVAFAHIAAINCFKVFELTPFVPCQMLNNKRLCHWYTDSSVAKLKRTNFDHKASTRRLASEGQVQQNIGIILYGAIRSSTMATVTMAATKEYILKHNDPLDVIFSVDTQSNITYDALFVKNPHSSFKDRHVLTSPQAAYERAMHHVLYGLRYLNQRCNIVIVARIDVEFNSYLKIEKIGENTIYVPRFHSYHNLNDRFVYGHRITLQKWFKRRLELTRAHTFAEKGACQAAKEVNIAVRHIPIMFVRRRHDLFVPDVDKATIWKTIPVRSWMSKHNITCFDN